eukprot:CAMPEP_0172490504 /NCGR_PEP_ID=MMETSP1066-20121228/20932_1 /TAXON_ID=671091 /ORGANISM="Coscinodiscus wailesii, Strain CCMP2513" /LENGTH=305 /DNA_ID=CAMNT_0013258997 /DNA_START=109 /DNA_END=1022 /DNA_ORIENTATION=-
MAPQSNKSKKIPRESNRVDLEDVLVCARGIMNRDANQPRAVAYEERNFRGFFGCSVIVAYNLWCLLERVGSLPKCGCPKQMLWALMFLKVYGKESEMSVLAGVDAKTLRKNVKTWIDEISLLEPMVIIWENRLKRDIGNDCLINVDGTDFRIPEHGREFYSHKFKKSGLRYEVGTCILTGDIVWINGPYECGLWPDINIFWNSLVSNLGTNERVEADDGYIGEAPRHVKCPKSFTNPRETLAMQQRVRNRHETVNGRFKQWGVLKQVFRHDITWHGNVFRCVAMITQLSINNGDALFECKYPDPP